MEDTDLENYMKSLNLSITCRTCLTECDEMISLFTEFESNGDSSDCEEISLVYQLLMHVSSIQISADDELPPLICKNCMDHAAIAFKFKLLCERSDTLLQTYINQYDKKEVNDATLESIEPEQINNDDDIPAETEISIKNELFEYDDDATAENLLTPQSEIKLEAHDEAALVASNEENVKLRERIHMKKMFKIRSRNYTCGVNEQGERRYICNSCKKQYKHKTSLNVHLRSHTADAPYLCNLCGKRFKQCTGLSYHMRSHTGEQPYSCTLCEKKYRQSASLTAHMRIHTGQRPYLCSVCGKGFRQKPDLTYHMRTHTKEKPYMCNVCGKQMTMQCHLVQHMRTHTGEKPYTCAQCSKSFVSSTRLKRHEIIHTDLKPYTCDVCSKSFNRSSTLRVHELTHMEKKPHVCATCGKGFIQAHCLRTHLKLHDNIYQILDDDDDREMLTNQQDY